MSIDSALIVRKDSLISVAELTAAIAERGVTIVLPADFALDRDAPGPVRIEIDGEPAVFEYGVEALADLEPDAAPAKLRRYGDTMLSFAARGALAAEAVSLIQRVLAERCKAAGWIDEELVSPREMVREAVIPDDMDPDLAATMRGTPAERAAAIQAYIVKSRPPRDRRADALNTIKPLIIPAIIVVIFAAAFLWTQLK